MAYSQNVQIVGKKANGDLSAKQYYLLKVDSAEDDVALAGDNGVVYGVLYNEPEDNEAAEVATIAGNSELKCVTDGSISIAELMVSDANGKATTMASAAKQKVFGIALEAGAADGEIVRFTPAQCEVDNS